jgi:hypothetical protein
LASAWKEKIVMSACAKLTQEMLTSPITVAIPSETLTFLTAREFSDNRARAVSSDAMLLAWFDKKTGAVSPSVECCREDKPGWLVRGGKIVIDINDEEYVFIYLG